MNCGDDQNGGMSFTNPDVDLTALPRFDEARLHALHPRYPRLVLALVALTGVPAFLVVAVVVSLLDRILGFAIVLGVLALFAAVAWFAHRAASVIRYAVRRHDVIVRSGVFWRKEAVQPIKRIQHVEEVQGPLDKLFGLSTLKLFSAGTGHVTFQIPGLDVATAAALSRFILSFHEPAAGAHAPAAATHAASGTAAGAAAPAPPADAGPSKPAANAAPPSGAADAVREGARPRGERSEP